MLDTSHESHTKNVQECGVSNTLWSSFFFLRGDGTCFKGFMHVHCRKISLLYVHTYLEKDYTDLIVNPLVPDVHLKVTHT